jgi:hypothetical protein
MAKTETKTKRRPRGPTDRSLAETYLVPEFGKKLGIGRDQAYEAAKVGEIPVIRVGARYLVPKALGDAMLRGEWTPPRKAEASA